MNQGFDSYERRLKQYSNFILFPRSGIMRARNERILLSSICRF